jgi:SpoVK/Ycf46/Vps4 family AAA+-type ATPase
VLEHLHLKNVGPAPELTMELGPRLNLITGDNGLGKSFLLDIAWWALTRKWPAEVNPRLASGLMARPRKSGEASIELRFTGMAEKDAYRSAFDRKAQAWKGRGDRPSNPGLVLYAQADGGVSVWDPARNYWQSEGFDVQERPAAYIFSPGEVWNGLKIGDTVACTGLLFDWVLWKGLGGEPFAQLVKVLEALSPPEGPPLSPGPLVRLGLEGREMPTLTMPYGVDVPLVHASAGMRRVIGLAYILVWAWQEHVFASRELEQPTTKQVVFLVDEVEAHLHPRWQRRILKSLLAVMESMIAHAGVQVVAATHSPLILASAVSSRARSSWSRRGAYRC